jgi:hypothetical protein
VAWVLERDGAGVYPAVLNRWGDSADVPSDDGRCLYEPDAER